MAEVSGGNASRLEIDETTWRQARDTACKYSMVLMPKADGKGFIGTSVELGSVVVSGATQGECMQVLQEALILAVAVMLRTNQEPPVAQGPKRQEQLNIRLTSEEKTLLRCAAERERSGGVSAFVRDAALDRARQAARR